MTQRVPDYPPSPSPVCGRMVNAGGLMSYRCTLPQSHHEHGPEDDREPCWAMESTGATRLWQAWRERQDAREGQPETGDGGRESRLTCPLCGDGEMVVDQSGEGTCESCGRSLRLQSGAYSLAEHTAEAMDRIEQPTQKQEAMAPVEWDGFKQVATATRCPSCGARVTAHREVLNAMDPSAGVDMPCCGARTIAGYLMNLFDQQVAEVERLKPTKQREGDQRLPDGGMDCVQDRVIADMEESKRVGIERYGDTLHTFNGRRGFVDIHDEVRDLFVYLTQMRMEAEADRETLVEVVAKALRSELPEIGEVLARRGEHIAEIAVDRIMGWVVAERQTLSSQGGGLLLDDRVVQKAFDEAFDGQKFFPADHGLLVSHGQSLREDLTPEQRREAEGIAVEALRLLRDKSLAAGLLKKDWT